MIVWRIIGWIVLLAGLSVLVRDAIAGFDTGVWRPIAVGQLWYDIDRSSLNLVQAVTQRYVSPFLWNQDGRSCAAVLGVCRADRLGCLRSAAHPTTTPAASLTTKQRGNNNSGNQIRIVIMLAGPSSGSKLTSADFSIAMHPAVGEKSGRATCRKIALPAPRTTGAML